MYVRVGPLRRLTTKNWCFWTVLREKTLESLLDCKKTKQSILQEISPEHSLEGLMLKLKLQYFGHLMWRANSLEKILMLGKTEGTRRRGQQRMRWLDGIIDSMDMSLSKLWEIVKDRSVACCSPWGCKESEMTEWLNNNSCNNNKRSHNYLVTAPSITLQSWSAEYVTHSYTLLWSLQQEGGT